ncbi:hypothetical protein D3C77_499190 [compost metagenome]
MQRVLQGTLLSILVVMPSFGAVADERQKVHTAGDINLEGRIVYSSCAVGAPEVAELISWQEGRVISAEWTDAKLFDIRLSECVSSVSQQVSASFSGVEEGDGSRFIGSLAKDEEDAWDWSDGRVVIRVANAPTLVHSVNGPVFRFQSKFKFLVPMSSESLISVPVYFLVAYP